VIDSAIQVTKKILCNREAHCADLIIKTEKVFAPEDLVCVA
jgi:hypothetical protein